MSATADAPDTLDVAVIGGGGRRRSRWPTSCGGRHDRATLFTGPGQLALRLADGATSGGFPTRDQVIDYLAGYEEPYQIPAQRPVEPIAGQRVLVVGGGNGRVRVRGTRAVDEERLWLVGTASGPAMRQRPRSASGGLREAP